MAESILIKEKEVMEKLEITSRTTMWKYCHIYNFPKPVRTHPKSYLRRDVEAWILRGGVNQQSF
jgi:predicted DNA-binding transcriptional regulator AlpA